MISTRRPQKFSPRFEVVNCYLEHGNSILLLHRLPNKSEGGKWGLPGGKVDAGESILDAMVREIAEETSIWIEKNALSYIVKVFVKYPDYDFVYHMFRTRMDEKPVVRICDAEHQGYAWASFKEALEMRLVRDLDACMYKAYPLFRF